MEAQLSLSLYLHIPFCRHRCAYCDFNTYTSLAALQEPYALALAGEVRQVAGWRRLPAHTIYLGGGTPSLMSPSSIDRILKAVTGCFELAQEAEITLEANPETVGAEHLEHLRALGINRLSLGAQSAASSELALLERQHSFETVVNAVSLARTAGFENLNLDLLYGLPDQSLANWERSLRATLALAPEHLSLYCLTVEPGTPMQRWLQSGRLAQPEPDLAADQYDLACELLASHDYIHYEISSWASPGRECRHNLTYWRNSDYLGLGAGAHGQAAGYRYHVVKQPRVYLRRLQGNDPGHFPWSAAVAGKYRPTRRQAMADTLVTQLRLLAEGLDLDAFAVRFGETVAEAYPGTSEQLMDWGLLQEQDGRLLLTRRGWFLSNQVFYRFV